MSPRIWIRWKWGVACESIARWIVWHLLPHRVVYWAAIRVAAHATTGPYANQIVPELSAMDALDRWDSAAEQGEAK